jgi:geranylgeranyl reductase family protein
MDCTQSTLAQQALSRLHPRPIVDVTIIGAGPSGTLLAYLLAVQGLRVAIVEKARLPRVKPCGGGLNQKTVDLLPFPIDTVIERVVSRLTFTQRLRRPFSRTYPAPLVSLVTRCTFDHLLVQRAAAAGAQVYEACRVTELADGPRQVRVHTTSDTWNSRYLVFADGAKGTARRQLGFPPTAPHDIGLDMDVEASATCPWTPDRLYIDWGSYPQGYAWAFPKADHWSIGVKGPVSQSRMLPSYLRQFMQRWGLQPPPGKLPYLAHMLPTRTPEMPLVRGRALVLGDAAGLLEPLRAKAFIMPCAAPIWPPMPCYRRARALWRPRVMRLPWRLRSCPSCAAHGRCNSCSTPIRGSSIAWCAITIDPGAPLLKFCVATAALPMSSAS